MALDTKKIKTILALTILLVSTICSAQVQYCGSDSSAKTLVNLLQQSETFDNASWTKSSSTVTANSTVAPDGTSTADSIIEAAATAYHEIRQQQSVVTGNTYRYSVYVKSSTRTFSTISVYGVPSGSRAVNINLATCATATVSLGGWSTFASATGTLGADGWCQVVVTYATTGTGLVTHTVGPATAVNGETTYAGDGTSGIFAWGAQLNLASSPSDYIATTDTQVTAGTANTSAKVTLSNFQQRSEELDNAAWLKFQSTATANVATAPDGANTADRLTCTSASSQHYFYNNPSPAGLTAGNTEKISLYVKKENHRYISITNAYNDGIVFDFDTGLYNNVAAALGTSSQRIESLPNGWYRITLTYLKTDSATRQVYVGFRSAFSSTSGIQSYTCAGTETFLVWGMQLNNLNQSPDYLATTSAAATLGPLCPSGTSQSLNDPSRCFAVRDNRIRRW